MHIAQRSPQMSWLFARDRGVTQFSAFSHVAKALDPRRTDNQNSQIIPDGLHQWLHRLIRGFTFVDCVHNTCAVVIRSAVLAQDARRMGELRLVAIHANEPVRYLRSLHWNFRYACVNASLLFGDH